MDFLWFILFPVLLLGTSKGIDLHFENPELGFFFQQSSNSAPNLLPKFLSVHSISNGSLPDHSDVRTLLKERLTVLRPSYQSKIQVTYGPFEAKQTLPAHYVVPDMTFSRINYSLPYDNVMDHSFLDITAHIVNPEIRRENPVLRVLFHSGRHFHSPSEDDSLDKLEGDESWENDHNGFLQPCIALYVHNPNSGLPLTGTCAPQGLDGVCLVSITLPYDWWLWGSISPTLASLTTSIQSVTPKPNKAVRNVIELNYAVYETKFGQCVPQASTEKFKKFRSQKNRRNSIFPPVNAILIQSHTPIGSVRLLPNVYAPRDLISSEEHGSNYPTLRFISSSAPLYPRSYFFVTVILDCGPQLLKEEPYAIVVRPKVKNGLRIVSTQATNPAWNLNLDINGKHISASATVVRNFSVPATNKGNQELFTWLLSVNVESKDSSELTDGIRILWSWTIRSHTPYRPAHTMQSKDGLEEKKGRFTTRFEVLKDEIQAVFPIIKRRELFNTAILTGRQVSEPLRVFMVTFGGKVADVTLQAYCSSSDESVLKVSSSCTSVFLDGSEVRGSTNATFIARYGSVESSSTITVWVPELPLDIQVDDVKLNQIHGWKVQTDKNQCRLKYQQTLMEVFARFYAEDHDSGRVSYFLSRKTYLLVTSLVRKFIRLQDPRIAILKQNYIEGIKPGRTEIQVLSPMSGHVIATRELRVSVEKVDITNMSAQVISGLSLNIIPDPDLESCYTAEVDISEKLSSKYQEAILDLTLHFSDGTLLPLRHTERSHYNLLAESLNVSTLALTSPIKSAILRVLALGDGKGNVNIVMSSGETCQSEGQNHPLAVASALVEVSLRGNLVTSVQNDARTSSESSWPDATQSYTLPHTLSNQIIGEASLKRRTATNSSSGIGQGQLTFSKPGTEFSENQLSLRDDSNAITVIGSPIQLSSNSHHFQSHSSFHLTPLEIGMYVLLAIFCAAIFVFVGTCVVYASRARKSSSVDDDVVLPPPNPLRLEQIWNKFQKKKVSEEENNGGNEPQETSDRNWVWLGRSTLDNPGQGQTRSASNQGEQMGDSNGNHTSDCSDKGSNRLSGISYSGSEVSVRITTRSRPQDGGRLTYTAELCFSDEVDSTETPEDMESGNQKAARSPSIDTQTYTKKNAVFPMRIVTNPNFAAAPCQHRNVGITANLNSSHQTANDEAFDMNDNTEPLLMNVVRRPRTNRHTARLSEQDTRRYARSWLMAGEAVPRDFNSNSSSVAVFEEMDNNSNLADKNTENYVTTFIRKGSPDIKRANIIENPRFSSAVSDEDNNTLLNNDNATVDTGVAVDYEKIISYLGILKETSA